MKITSKLCNLRGSRAVRFVAVIPKSAKLGIAKRKQKTWSFPTVAPEFTLKEMAPSIEAEAKRWEQRVLAEAQPKVPKVDECHECDLIGKINCPDHGTEP